MLRLSIAITDNADKMWRATALAIDATVVTATPVDTGRARANWRVNTEPTSDVYDAFAKGKAGSTSSTNTQGALDAGSEAIRAATGDVIYISNNLPYIEFLNDGSSAQAPAGFIELAVQAGADQIKSMRILDDGH